MEGMACKVPQINPDWSALGEWTRGGALLVPCTTDGIHPGGINTIGGIVDRELLIDALEYLYKDTEARLELGISGFNLVKNPDFTWQSVAARFNTLFTGVLNAH